jgi:hypothetical protein
MREAEGKRNANGQAYRTTKCVLNQKDAALEGDEGIRLRDSGKAREQGSILHPPWRDVLATEDKLESRVR